MDVMTDYRSAAENAPFYYTVSPWLTNFWCLKKSHLNQNCAVQGTIAVYTY